jgi:hypothetical protein
MSDEELIESIEKACYFIPAEHMQDTGSGKPFAYIQGITNGRKQAIEIIRGRNG